MAKGRGRVGESLQYRRADRVFDQTRCWAKTKWGSEESAQRALTNLKRQNPEAFDSTVRPYRCSACKKWHVGHGR